MDTSEEVPKRCHFMTTCLKRRENESRRCLRRMKGGERRRRRGGRRELHKLKTDQSESLLIHENHIRADHILFDFIPIQLVCDERERQAGRLEPNVTQ